VTQEEILCETVTHDLKTLCETVTQEDILCEMEKPLCHKAAARPKDDEGLLKGISRQQREHTAVEGNNAEVPEYLWEEHLTKGSQVQDWDYWAIRHLRSLSAWLREQMPCWWKQKVTSLYVAWVKLKHELKSNPPNLGSIVKANLEGNELEWTKGGQDQYEWEDAGRDSYWKWWKEQFISTFNDVIPTSVAIYRAAKSSWWNWDDGSPNQRRHLQSSQKLMVELG
jgi:hypothetical protein